MVKSHLNEPLLQQIADATGGFYLPLRGADTMDMLYDRGLAPLPKSEGKEKLIRQLSRAISMAAGGGDVVAAGGNVFAGAPKLRPGRSPKSKAKRAEPVPAPCWPRYFVPAYCRSKLQPRRPARCAIITSGNFTNALTEFTQLAEVRTNDLRLVFNAGDAAYRATNFDLRAKLFQQVTLSPDLKLQQQAFYNLGNTQFQLAKQAEGSGRLATRLETADENLRARGALNTNDVDAAFNLAFVKKPWNRSRQFKRGDAAGEERGGRGGAARGISPGAGNHESRCKQSIAAKQFEDFTKKLKDIDDIATPHHGRARHSVRAVEVRC